MRYTSVLIVLSLFLHMLTPSLLASIIGATHLEQCTQSGDPDVPGGCKTMMVVELTIESGKSTESVTFKNVTLLNKSTGQSMTVMSDVSLSLSKIQASLQGSLVYWSNFPSGLDEYTIFGTDYLVTDSCRDRPDVHTCPTVIDLDTGKQVPYSEGTCCSCGLMPTFGYTQRSRANLKCDLFGSQSAAANCMRMSQLQYQAYKIEPPIVFYTITVTMNYTDVNGYKVSNEYIISPSNPVISAEGIVIKLEGDFSPPQVYRTFESSIFVVPDPKTDPSNPRHSMPMATSSLVLPNGYFTSSSSVCSKIGTGYKAYYTQPNFCMAEAGSCIDGQIDDYWKEDMAKKDASKATQYLLSTFNPDSKLINANGNLMLNIPITTIHNSFLTIKAATDGLTLYINQSPGKILEGTGLETFGAMSNDGILKVVATNNGTLISRYYVFADDCSPGITPMPAQVFTMDPSEIKVLTFKVHTKSTDLSQYHCKVSLTGDDGRVLDWRIVYFNTTATIIKSNNYTDPYDPKVIDTTSKQSCSDVCTNDK
ncbi:hypothetical protein SAMD00019534_003370 [Acytostelium subglobosum LB1]|uniref:hypothetical protein n=1 Tax=Acytostelium subglobosum LB1 TaxID=1410327 RepID=UPI000644D1E6|nr:hypothetical protein SAMD00019534_003370 [Acytostelium subglobosum LB1]GAM17162.1 hypothetical protein SAMD00019534_003370 [Acytostelium subglobosum LB1]|eukprot:XP_012759224.1 hypothetical protein SAMD00019534_003370 [Acytostelium subglobosum LB1]